jgi:hypothetical protein
MYIPGGVLPGLQSESIQERASSFLRKLKPLLHLPFSVSSQTMVLNLANILLNESKYCIAIPECESQMTMLMLNALTGHYRKSV